MYMARSSYRNIKKRPKSFRQWFIFAPKLNCKQAGSHGGHVHMAWPGGGGGAECYALLTIKCCVTPNRSNYLICREKF